MTQIEIHPFAARRMTTALEWNDLVLPETTLDEVEEIRAWIAHRDTLLHERGAQAVGLHDITEGVRREPRKGGAMEP